MGYAISILAIAFLALSADYAVSEPTEIAKVGTWHGSEGPMSPGDGWWGLFPVEGGYVLESAEVTVVPDSPPMGDKTGGRTGKKLSISQKTEPLFLVRGANRLKEGPVVSLALPPEGTFLYPGQALNLTQTKEGVTDLESLVALGTYAKLEESYYGFSGYRLRLISETSPTRESQVVASVSICDPYSGPRIFWAGDLDGDGKTDLFLDISKYEINSHFVLYLSSAAKEGELVGLVGEWITLGC